MALLGLGSKASLKASTSETKGHEVLDNISKLELRILALERDKIGHFRNWRHEFQATIHPLEDMETKLASESKEKEKELCNQIKQIKKHVTNFSAMLTDLNSGQTFVEKLKCTMEEIEASITTLKRKHSEEFELLLHEEEILSQEITAFDKKLESWSTATSSKQPQATAGVLAGQQHKPDADKTPPPVLAFERFLQQTGGHQGGWDDYDYQTFLKLRSKYSDLSVFLERAVHELPTRSLSEIQQHDQWYTEYSTLLDNKKKAITAWKRQKQSKHEDIKTDKDLLGTKGQSKRNELFAKEREERFARLHAWKTQQENNRTKLEEERLRVELHNKKAAIEKEKKRRGLIKEQVEEYIQNREERERVKQQGIEMERMKEKERRKAATKEVICFRERDLIKVTERQEAKLKEKAEEQLWRERKLEKLKQQVKVNAERDPARLLKPTASVKEKRKGVPGSGLGGVVLVMPRRAVPSWRQT